MTEERKEAERREAERQEEQEIVEANQEANRRFRDGKPRGDVGLGPAGTQLPPD